MNHKNITPGTLVEGSVSSTDISSDEINQLKAQMQDMQLEIDILKETINVLKKDPDIDQNALSNREKAVIIDVLKNRYSLPLLLQKLQLSKSSYYYQEQSLQKEDKYTLLRVRVIELFTENKGRYGYRRIHALLKRENIIVSEKVIRRIMKEEQLVVKIKRTRKYNSYQGEISPAVDNLINRNFSASKPNEKWLTDITEFAIPAGKVYLSPIVDCFDAIKRKLIPEGHFGTDQMIILMSDDTYAKYQMHQTEFDRYYRKQLEERVRMEERSENIQSILNQGNIYIQAIRDSNAIIKDKEISQKLDKMEQIVTTIFHFIGKFSFGELLI